MIKLFIADDNPLILQSLSQSINWSEYGIELIGKATNGNEALEKIIKLQPHIIITDIRMPNLSGINLIEAIKEKKLIHIL